MKTVLITSLAGMFDQKLAEVFVREGLQVFAIGSRETEGVTLLPDDLEQARAALEKAAGKIDLYIDVSDTRSGADRFTLIDGLDEKIIREVYEANVLWPMASLEAFINLIDAGEGKRVCFLTSQEASINQTRDIGGYAYKLSKAAMHNFFQMIANRLTPDGYTLRVFDPMHREIAPELAAESAFNYFTRRRGTEGANPLRDDEARWVFRDALGREHPW
ncbi:MAG: hypothetical protein FWH02_07950 [Oscillospiraceae bacterium]|nr:hypothetical protein [Oscillospiraceae bacterium]